MLDNKLLSILYWIFISFVVLPSQFCNCTKVKDYHLGATSTSENYLNQNLYPATAESPHEKIVNKEIYNDIKFNIRKINNPEINHHPTNTNNLLKSYTQKFPIENEAETYKNIKKYNEKDKFVFNVLSTTESYSFQDMIANHRKYLHMNFEKHKAQSLKSTQYNHQKRKIEIKTKNNLNHNDNQNYHSNNNIQPSEINKKSDAFQTRFNQKKPYYNEKLYSNDDKNPIENNPYTLYSQIKKSHKTKHLENPHHHHHHHHHHHQHNLNKQNHHHHNKKWPHLSHIQSEFYYDKNNAQINEDSLPPYIKKYNRRNKQLKNLLEGTIPITLHSSAISSQYEHRKHHHQLKKLKSIEDFEKNNGENYSKQHLRNHKKNPKWIIENLFEEQRSNPNNPNSNDDDNKDISIDSSIISQNSTQIDIAKMLKENKIPDDSMSRKQHYENYDYYNEEKPNILINKSQIITTNEGLNKDKNSYHNGPSNPKSFIYHRIDDPLSVGTGDTGKKQRLPFVAITDRRLETSKKLQHNQPINIELNNFPLP